MKKGIGVIMCNVIEKRYETLTQVFEDTVEKYGTRTAAVVSGKRISYETLNAKANYLANELIECGVRTEDIIAVQIPRSIELMITLVAIHKAGCAYMPIDAECPPDRMQFMIDDSGAEILIRKEGLSNFDGKIKRLFTVSLEGIGCEYNNPPWMSSGKNIAYVLYTSGSTGKPKGAMIEHRAIINRLYWMKNAYKITEKDRIMQKTPYTFDVSVWELFLSFFTGGTLYLAEPKTENDPNALAKFIEQNDITVCHFIPSMLNVMLRYLVATNRVDCMSSINIICCSGESLGYDLVMLYQTLLRDVYGTKLFNLYGPTEAAVDVTSFDCTYWKSEEGIVPIGYPIDNIYIYILDEKMKKCAINQPGELYISGVNVGRGYINRPILTKERFLDDIGENGGKMFRTGDIAQYDECGRIVFIGRLDNQIKVRGMRVEPEEIESVILQNIYGISRVVVCGVRKDNERNVVELCAVYEGDMDETDGMETVMDKLSKKLNQYMIPKRWIKVASIPVLTNGKIDRKEVERLLNCEVMYEANVEKQNIVDKIIGIIKGELHSVFQNQFSLEKSLQEAGIDSLTFMTIVVRLEEELGIRFDNDMLVYSRIDCVHTLVQYTERLVDAQRGK